MDIEINFFAILILFVLKILIYCFYGLAGACILLLWGAVLKVVSFLFGKD